MTEPDDDRSIADVLRDLASSDPATLIALMPHDIDELLVELPKAIAAGDVPAEVAGELTWRLRRLQDVLPRVNEPVMAMEAGRLLTDLGNLIVSNSLVGDRADRAAAVIVRDCLAYFAHLRPSDMTEMQQRFVQLDIADTIRKTQ